MNEISFLVLFIEPLNRRIYRVNTSLSWGRMFVMSKDSVRMGFAVFGFINSIGYLVICICVGRSY